MDFKGDVRHKDDESDSSTDDKKLDAFHRETSSELSRSYIEDEDDGGPHRGLMQTFDVDDYVHSSDARNSQQKPFWSRLLAWRRPTRDSRAQLTRKPSHPDQTQTLTSEKSGRFRSTIRTIFDYPEPGMKLRGTAWLDGLRGLAAFEVFIFHYNHDWVDEGLGWGNDQFSDPAWWRAPFVRTIYASGSAAVCVFFAISGYVLAHRVLSLYRQRRHEDAYTALSSAVFRRAIRLYLPVFLLSFILMLICRISDDIPKPTGYERQPTFSGEVANWVTTMVHMLVPLRYPDRWNFLIDPYGGGVSWTIPLEYYGSIVVFIALLFVSRTKHLLTRLALVMAMVAHSFIKDDWMAGQFLLGMAFADYQLEEPLRPTRTKLRQRLNTAACWALFIFGFYLAGIPGFHAKPTEPGTAEGQAFPVLPRPGFEWISRPLADVGFYRDRAADRYLECLAGMATMVGIGGSPFLKRALEVRFVQYLGKISFGLYLCHVPMRAWINKLDKHYLLLFGLDPTVPLIERPETLHFFAAYTMRMVPIVIINLILAGLFERFVDRPSVTLGKTLETWCLSFKSWEDEDAPYTPLPRHQSGERQESDAHEMQSHVSTTSAQVPGQPPLDGNTHLR